MSDLLNWETTETGQSEEEATPELGGVSLTATTTAEGRPNPKWVRGKCPDCGDDLVSNLYYVPGKGYLVAWECWSSLSESPTCGYRRIL